MVGIISLMCSCMAAALAPELKEEIQCLVNSNPHQLSVAEYGLIADRVISRSPCNMLVFGVGRDSRLWTSINSRGKTVFLEDNRMWLDHVRQNIPNINAHLVCYNTLRSRWQELLHRSDEQELLMELPQEITDTKWDIIFVDAPDGSSDRKPGRMKSIFTAAKLAHSSKGCDVYVHDCNRRVEAVYSNQYLHPENLIWKKDRLRYYYIP